MTAAVEMPARKVDLATAADELKVAQQRLERRLDELDDVAAWRKDLTARLRRESYLFELVDCMRTEEFDALVEEVEDFKAVCRALAQSRSERAAA